MLKKSLPSYRIFKNFKFTINKHKTPKEDKNVNIKISLKEIVHKIIRDKIEHKL